MQEATYPVTVRMPLSDIAKIDRLAQQTGRTRANLIKHLVAIVEATGVQDVRLVDKDHVA